MEKIIIDILNYKPSTIKARDKFTAGVTALCLDTLAKKDSTVSSDIELVFSDIEGGMCSPNTLQLSSSLFLDRYRYIEDINVVAHEIHHKYKFQKNPNDSSTIVYTPTHFQILLLDIIQRERPHLLYGMSYMGINGICSKDNNMDQVNKYFHSFYSLQPHELEADAFSEEVVANIFKQAKSMPLSAEEQVKLSSYIDVQKELVSRRHSITQADSSARHSKKTIDLVHGYTAKALEDFKRTYPDFFTSLSGMTIEQYNKKYTSPIDPIMLLVNILEVNYDETLARQFFQALQSSKLDWYKDYNLLNLAIWTPMKLDSRNTPIISEALQHHNARTHENISLDMIRSKKRSLITPSHDSITDGM